MTPPARSYFIPVPEWVILARLSPQALALYIVLRGHVSRSRGVAWPSQASLAALLGYSKEHSVRPYIRELVERGIVKVKVVRCDTGRRSEYTVLDEPPEGFVGHRSFAEYYATSKAGSAAVAADGCADEAADGSAARTAQIETDRPRPSHPDGSTSSDACAASGHFPEIDDQKRRPIFRPRGIEKWPDGRIHQHLVASSLAALKAAGLEPTWDAGDRLGHAIKVTHESVNTDELIRRLEGTLALVGTDDPTWGTLAIPTSEVDAWGVPIKGA